MNPQEGKGFEEAERPLLCRVGLHSTKADFPNRLDRCRKCGKTWKLHIWTPTSPLGRWLLRLFR